NRTHVACLEGRYSTIELHPLGFGLGGHARPMAGGEMAAIPDRQARCLGVSGLGVLGTSTKREWVEQDSNLRRQCHQIYSLAPLAAWVSTRERRPGVPWPPRPIDGRGRRPIAGRAELAVRVELTTVGLQNRCSAD